MVLTDLVADLGTGQLSGRHPELLELGAAGRDLATAVDEARERAWSVVRGLSR